MFTRRRGAKLAAFTAASALVLAACAGDDSETPAEPGDDTEPPAEEPADVEIVYGQEQEFSSYNNNTSEEGSVRNALVLNQVQTGFWFFGVDGSPEPDTEFGTYELVSENPQIVEFSINPEAVWSDGNAIDCGDFLLNYVANAGIYQSGEEDDDGNPLPLFSTSGTTGYEDWVKPDCEDGDKDFTVEYENLFADWIGITSLSANGSLPAHVAADQGGLTEAELIEAIRNDDVDAMRDAAEFYNTGWVMDPGQLLDESLIPSSGPYKLEAWDAGQSITLTPNENYWGTPPAAQTVTIRYITQDEQAQALENQEIDIADPQPNPDLVNQFEAIAGVVVSTGEDFTWEHLDFNMRPGSPFQDRELREAFAKCVPRQLIVENLIQPMNPEANVMDVRSTMPFQPDYANQVEGSGAENYQEVDIEGAQAILEDTGNVGMEVRIGYFTPNPRRTDQVSLIADSCGQAGFEIIDAGSDEYFAVELPNGDWDVAMYAWAGSALVSGWASTYTTVESCTPEGVGNNSQCYSNPEVDQLIADLNQETDLDAQNEMIKEVDRILWEDMATIPLYAFPNVAAWADDLENVVYNPSQNGITWNANQWTRM